MICEKIIEKFLSKIFADIKKSLTFASPFQTGCSSARLEYTSGGRVVAGSNPVTPTEQK